MDKLRYFFFTFWVGTILLLSLMPVPHVNAPSNTDKGVHFLMYFLTAMFFYGTFYKKYRDVVSFAFIFSALLGAFVEVLQYFVPYRSFSLGDILANSLGALFAWLSIFVFQKYRVKNQTRNMEKVE